jgi:transcriptional regulator with XRE-family HTH domain
MSDPFAEAWATQRAAIGAYIRSQRELSSLSLRELARLTQVSNAYLSQLERGLHDPSLRVLVSIAEALRIPVEDLLQRTRKSPGDGPGMAGETGSAGQAANTDTEAAIRSDPNLSTAEKDALLSVYRSYLRGREGE